MTAPYYEDNLVYSYVTTETLKAALRYVPEHPS